MLIPKKHTIFAQGDPTDAIFYLQTGKVRLTVVSKTGKEATIGVLSDGSFFGEGSLAGQPLRMGTAIAMTDCAVLELRKRPWWTRFTGNTTFPICSSHIC
jgi:CRP-like cAMP-binding protein